MPLAPARLSITTACLNASVSFGPIRRARMSVVPPGGKFTIKRIGLLGKSASGCAACAGPEACAANTSADAAMRVGSLMRRGPRGFVRVGSGSLSQTSHRAGPWWCAHAGCAVRPAESTSARFKQESLARECPLLAVTRTQRRRSTQSGRFAKGSPTPLLLSQRSFAFQDFVAHPSLRGIVMRTLVPHYVRLDRRYSHWKPYHAQLMLEAKQTGHVVACHKQQVAICAKGRHR